MCTSSQKHVVVYGLCINALHFACLGCWCEDALWLPSSVQNTVSSCSPVPQALHQPHSLLIVWYKTSSFSVLCKEPWRHRFKKSCYILPNTLIRQSLQGSYLLILKLPLTTVHDCFTLFLRMICRICPSGMLCNNCYS